MIVPPRTLVAGVPARILRELTDDELAWKVEGTQSYQELTRRSLATMRATSPLAALGARSRSDRAAPSCCRSPSEGPGRLTRRMVSPDAVQ